MADLRDGEGFNVCTTHWKIIPNKLIKQGMRLFCCPDDPCLKDLTKGTCHVAGPFKTETAARRWMCKREAEQIEADAQ